MIPDIHCYSTAILTYFDLLNEPLLEAIFLLKVFFERREEATILKNRNTLSNWFHRIFTMRHTAAHTISNLNLSSQNNPMGTGDLSRL